MEEKNNKNYFGMKFNKTFSHFFCSSNNDNYESSNSVNDEDINEETKDLKEKALLKIQSDSHFISLPLTYLDSPDYENNALIITKNKTSSHHEVKTGSCRKKKRNFFFPQEQMRSLFNGDEPNGLSEHQNSPSSSTKKKTENANSGFIIEGKRKSNMTSKSSIKNHEKMYQDKTLSLLEQDQKENEIFKKYYSSKQGFSTVKDSPNAQKSFFPMKTSQYFGKSLTGSSKCNNKSHCYARCHSNEEKLGNEDESTKFKYIRNQLFWYDFERMKDYKYYMVHNNSSEILKKLKKKKKGKSKSIKTKSYFNYI